MLCLYYILRVAVKYSGPASLVFHKSGSGSVDELKQHLADDQIHYALLRLQDPEKASPSGVFLLA